MPDFDTMVAASETTRLEALATAVSAGGASNSRGATCTSSQIALRSTHSDLRWPTRSTADRRAWWRQGICSGAFFFLLEIIGVCHWLEGEIDLPSLFEATVNQLGRVGIEQGYIVSLA